MSPIMLAEGTEILLDQQGRILRTSGDHPLPLPLGSVAQLFLPPLPAKAELKWDRIEDLTILDEPLGLGPTRGFGWMQYSGAMMSMSGPMNFRNMSPVLTVSQQTKCEIKAVTATTATIQQTLVLDSPLLVAKEPRVSANGSGSWTFDLAGGFLRAAEMDFQALLNSETSARRNTIKTKLQLLEGEERDKAIAAQFNRNSTDPVTGKATTRKLAGMELQKVFEDLQSDDESKRRAATQQLMNAELADPPVALINYLVKYLFDTDHALRYTAAKVVADYGTSEHVPDLLRLLKSSNSSVSWSAIRGLGRLKDPRAIMPLVECVATGGSESYQAASALENFGPEAEEAVLSLVKEKNTATKRAACGILRKLGTPKSVEALKELVANPDSSLSSSAAEALRAVQERL